MHIFRDHISVVDVTRECLQDIRGSEELWFYFFTKYLLYCFCSLSVIQAWHTWNLAFGVSVWQSPDDTVRLVSIWDISWSLYDMWTVTILVFGVTILFLNLHHLGFWAVTILVFGRRHLGFWPSPSWFLADQPSWFLAVAILVILAVAILVFGGQHLGFWPVTILGFLAVTMLVF